MESSTSELGIAPPHDPLVVVACGDERDRAHLVEVYQVQRLRTRAVTTAREALEIVEHESPDLVILGPALADLDAGTTCRVIKANARTHLIPVILVAHGRYEALRHAALEAGADDCFLTPVVGTELLERTWSLLRTRGLVRALEERRSELRLRSDWVRFLVHDLGNPMAAVLANLEFVDTQLDGDAARREEHDALGDCLAELRRMVAMVRDLLDVDRCSQGHLTVRPSAVELLPLLERVEHELGWVSRARGTPLRFEVEPGLTVWADPELLRRTLENLCRNALTFGPRDRPIDVVAAREPGAVRVTVINRGPPVPPEERERVFQPFVRLEEGAPREGAGLGLAFCRLVLEAHGGRIFVEDPPGGGAAFAFVLPDRAAPD